jgi:D-amino peptidase
MNIFIMTDLEGITGVDAIGDVEAENGSEKRRAACENLMADANAAIAGFFDGGATHVYVTDGHGLGDNFIFELLDGRAEVLTVAEWSKATAAGRIDAYAEIGMHAMAGTQNAFLDHTQSSTQWFDYRINGRSYGEFGIAAAFSGIYGVPAVMVSGDIAACEEAKRFMGDIETAAVKRAVGRNKAVSLPAEQARAQIYEAAKRAAGRVGSIPPYRLLSPAEIRLTFQRTDYCESTLRRCKDAERLDSRTVRKYVSKPEKYFDFFL